jgi:ribosomal protein S18 acetylase RimI-like enzyme
MKIVCANKADLPATMHTIAACVAELNGVGIDQWDEDYPDTSVIGGAVESRSLYVIKKKEKVLLAAGLDTVQPKEYNSCQWRYGEPALVVHHLCVHPALWRRGLAGQFMEFAEDYARTSGLGSVRLDAYLHNPAALSLYRARGYSEAGQVVFPRKGLRFVCFEKEVQSNAT